MRKLKIFGPHWELKIFVTDKMEKEFLECGKKIKDADYTYEADCEHCSWSDTGMPSEFGCRLCELYEVEKALKEGGQGEKK